MKINTDDVVAAIHQANIIPDASTLRYGTRLLDQGVDSLGIFSLMMVLQEKYDIEIPDPDIDKLTTIELIVDYLNGHLN